MARGKKINVNNLKQTHGALSAPKTIEELTGQVEGYPVDTLEEYREYLATLSDMEMHEHAIEVANVVPVPIRSLLIDRLETKFVSVKGNRAPIMGPSNMKKKDQEFQKKFLNNDL